MWSNPARVVWLLLVSLGSWMLGAAPASACSVPVFRYALERWAADPYEALVFHRGELSERDRAIAERLAGGKEWGPINVAVKFVDLDAEPDEALVELWEAEVGGNSRSEARTMDDSPWVVVRAPFGGREPVRIWSGRLAEESVARLRDSPARREVARRILKGDSAVWVLLESGDAAEDDAAAELLKSQLRQMEDQLELPDPLAGEDLAGLSDPEGEPAASGVDLKVAFSIVRVSRDDPDERAFVSMLVKSEPDLEDFSMPMAFPVFGRGRALYALVGKGINADTIHEACQFLIGACSCQVKDLNPGVDLLMAVAWEDLIEGRAVIDKELPPLAGLSKFAELPADLDSESHTAADGDDRPAPAAGRDSGGRDRQEAGNGESRADEKSKDGGTDSATSSPLGRNVLIVTLLALTVVLAGTAALRLRNR